MDPNDLDPEILEPEEARGGDPQRQGRGVCDLLSGDEIESVLTDPVAEGQAIGELGEVEACQWPHRQHDKSQDVQVLRIRDGEIPGEELFASIAHGEATQVPGGEEAAFNENTQSLWVRSQETVLQLQLSGFDAEEEAFVELAEVMVENH